MRQGRLSLRLTLFAAVFVLLAGGAPVAMLTATAAQEEQTIVFWDTHQEGAQLELSETLAAEFEEMNPGVAVEHRGWALDELQETLPRAVQSDEGPDISQVNNGESLMGPMVRSDLLVPMDQYDEQYGWSDNLPPGLLDRNRYSEDGQTFGEGTLWGVSNLAEIVGFYYNRQIFEDNGVEVPQTFEELEAAMATFQEAGVTPLVFGSLDPWTAIHLYGEIHGTMIDDREYLDDLIYRQGERTWETDAIVQAATKLQEWVDQGYLIEGFEGITPDDASNLFHSGGGAMMVQGSWHAGDAAEAMGDNVGFFLMPPAGDNPNLHVGGVGIPYAIMNTTPDVDLAAEFVAYLASDRAFELAIELGLLPGAEVPADAAGADTVASDLYAAWNMALENDTIGHYMDWATPTMYDTLTAELQELLAGQVAPEEFAATLQQDYAESFATGG